MFDYTVLRGGGGTCGYRQGQLHNEELKIVNASPDIFVVIKPRKTRWDRHVAPTGKTKLVHFDRKILSELHSMPLDHNFLQAQETFLQNVKAGSGAHKASCSVGTGSKTTGA
jgi:hypothetical protein